MSSEVERNGNAMKRSPPLNRSQSRSRTRSRSPRSRSRSPRNGGASRRGRGGGRKSDTYTVSKMVYISNIPYDIRWMELKDLVREKAGEVSFVEMIEKDGRSKGCAVVEFKTSDSAAKCIDNMHRMEMSGRFLVVKEIRDPDRFFKKVKEETGVDFMANKSGPQSLLSRSAGFTTAFQMPSFETYGLSPTFLKQLAIDPPLCNRVFVANLPYMMTCQKLKEMFSLAGQVTDVDLQLDKDGKFKGLAVIEYFHPIEAVQCISMLHGQKYQDRSITVKMDRFDKIVEPRRPGELPSGLKGVGMGLGANGVPLTNIATLIASGSLGGSTVTPFSNTSSASRLSSIGNLPTAAAGGFVPGGSTADLLSLGAGGGVGGDLSIGGARMYSNLMTSSSATRDSLANSSAARGADASRLFADELLMDASRDRRTSSGVFNQSAGSYGNSGSFSDMFGSRGGGGAVTNSLVGNSPTSLLPSGGGDFDRYTRGMSPLGDVGGRSTIRPARSIVIRNLPLDYSWQTLRDRLRGFGEVEFADMIQPGVGKVRFKMAADAEKAAVSLHGMHVEGRQIGVDLAD